MRGSLEENRRRGDRGAGVRAARHRHLRRRPVLRRLRRIRKGEPEDILDRDHGLQPRTGGGDARSAADDLVPQHLVLGRLGRARAWPADGADGRSSSSSRSRMYGRRYAPLPGGRRAPLHRERDEHRAPVRRPERDALCQGRVPRVPGRTAGGTRSIPASAARRPRRASASRSPPEARPGCVSACPEALEHGDPLGRSFDRAIAARAGRGRRVLRRRDPGHAFPRTNERHAAGLRRHDLVEAVLRLRRPPLARGRPRAAAPAARARSRAQRDWKHLYAADILSMPDTWEFPWFAAWDLAFHCVVLALDRPPVREGPARPMLREWYMHPNGQIPAYEWAFGDVNPPVHAWAALRVSQIEKRETAGRPRCSSSASSTSCSSTSTGGSTARTSSGNNIFQGGFLGLDNIGVFDRNTELPAGLDPRARRTARAGWRCTA